MFNKLLSAGAIITNNIPENSIAYGVNKFKNRDTNYDFLY
jgi:serine O-acetyltransferase